MKNPHTPKNKDVTFSCANVIAECIFIMACISAVLLLGFIAVQIPIS